MNKKDLPLFVMLIALVFLWPTIDRALIKPLFPTPPAPPAVEAPQMPDPAAPAPETPAMVAAPETPAVSPAAPAAEEDPAQSGPGEELVIPTDAADWTFQTHGAALSRVRLKGYRATQEKDSPDVVLEFGDAPALAWSGLPGLGAGHPFTVEKSDDGRTLRFVRRAVSGLELVRVIEIRDAHQLHIRDEFRAGGGAGVELPSAELVTGTMRTMPGESQVRGIHYLGIDTLPPGGEKVRYWGKEFPGMFKNAPPSASGRPPADLDTEIASAPVEWVAAKNKYFVQIVMPLTSPAQAVRAAVARRVDPREASDPTFRKAPTDAGAVTARLRFDGAHLAAQGEPVVREFDYYAGPKKFDILKTLTHRRQDVMEFGFFGGVSKILLQTLNLLYRVIPNYGVAIILLTILVRILFWPITHKSTESMKRMAEIQPLIQEMRAKYKDPQRQQKEMMALYKQYKINPLGGCLPILVQIPVFIALFVMLRSAIELRFAPFLWVRDLSEPENLLAGMIPLVGSLNILPLLMTATQVWQQKMTPSAGDPAQQKMMLWMPIIMLVFFYHFASGLVLYWTTNQVLMIIQLSLQKYRRTHPTARAA
ncbi:MAG: membrane protein insertase YidC [Kiritimatiellae bacterium]|nr:membrane protein insertase YidC [Kiritimatiellia bacterium]